MESTLRGRNGYVQQAPSFPEFSSNIQFSDPWGRQTNPTSAPFAGLTATTMAGQTDMSSLSKPVRQNSVSSSYDPMSLNMSSMPSSRSISSQMMNMSPDYLAASLASSYPDQTVTSAPTSSAISYGSLAGYNSYESPTKNLQNSLIDYSRPSITSGSYTTAADMDSARGMLQMSQNATRFSGYPTAHRTSSSAASSNYYPQSNTSSISSASSYNPYYGSMDSSASDLSSMSDMYDTSRSLPRPLGMVHSQLMQPGNPQQQMMSTFNSRIQQNTSKKHKCKVCDKRFTRPSSLTTHMYSHTGEKPFACDHENCGKQFSVVSNLRRHRKVHRLPGTLPPDQDDNASVAGSIASMGSV